MGNESEKLVDFVKRENAEVSYNKDSNMVTVSKGGNFLTFESGKGQNYGMKGEINDYNYVQDADSLSKALNGSQKGRFDLSYKPKNNSATIASSLNKQANTAINSINSALNKKVREINVAKSLVPQKYRAVRNNLSVNNEQQKRLLNEHIANTGNHQAGGYAVSSRLNNLNSLNKTVNDTNIAEQNALVGLENEIANTRFNAANKIAEIRNAFESKRLEYILKENQRIDSMNLDVDKFNAQGRIESEKIDEEKRMNDAEINDMVEKLNLAKNDDLRKQQIHEIDATYLPQKYQADLDYTYVKIDGEQANTDYTKTKIESEKTNNEYTKVKIEGEKAQTEKTRAETQKVKSTPVTISRSSGGSSSSKSSNSDITKLSTKDLAASIKNQASTIKNFKSNGDVYYEMDPKLATDILLKWKSRYKLSTQEMNDIAIILGIQSYV